MSGSSPFHAGEQALQARVGKRQQMEQLGQKYIRTYMPEQHRQFFAQLPFMLVGSVDKNGWPWASILCGEPGFASSATPTSLHLTTHIIQHDPLANNIRPNAALGLLGIELHSRRRNRLNARVAKVQDKAVELEVEQSFGNCPQYIQGRALQQVKEYDDLTVSEVEYFSELSLQKQEFIRQADTFFVSSYIHSDDKPEVEGVDISHRGGNPGFIKVEGNSLLIPDFAGNNFFNTLGNFMLNPKAGLLLMDFNSGDVLMLTGTVEIIWQLSPEIEGFEGALRAWRFHLHQGIKLSQALPYRFDFIDYSPRTLSTGYWNTATNKEWRSFTLLSAEDESRSIRSFRFKPTDNSKIDDYLAGQHVSIRVKQGSKKLTRQYTLTSSSDDDYYQISVKLEPKGKVSSLLHQQLQVGDQVEIKAATGNFVLNTQSKRPVLLIGAGVGITPIYAMAKSLVQQNYPQQIEVWHSTSSMKERAFYSEFRHMFLSHANLNYLSFITGGEPSSESFERRGRIQKQDYQTLADLKAYDIYLCGPQGFMQAQYTLLTELGVNEQHIFSETFGPSVLKKRPNPQMPKSARVIFSSSNLDTQWQPDKGSLLEFAEKQGLEPEYSCRSGSCGSCKVAVLAGSVSYTHPPEIQVDNQHALLCCSVPASSTAPLILDL